MQVLIDERFDICRLDRGIVRELYKCTAFLESRSDAANLNGFVFGHSLFYCIYWVNTGRARALDPINDLVCVKSKSQQPLQFQWKDISIVLDPRA